MIMVSHRLVIRKLSEGIQNSIYKQPEPVTACKLVPVTRLLSSSSCASTSVLGGSLHLASLTCAFPLNLKFNFNFKFLTQSTRNEGITGTPDNLEKLRYTRRFFNTFTGYSSFHWQLRVLTSFRSSIHLHPEELMA